VAAPASAARARAEERREAASEARERREAASDARERGRRP
jgi:hypothetical protein